jgi:hypothetical protein
MSYDCEKARRAHCITNQSQREITAHPIKMQGAVTWFFTIMKSSLRHKKKKIIKTLAHAYNVTCCYGNSYLWPWHHASDRYSFSSKYSLGMLIEIILVRTKPTKQRFRVGHWMGPLLWRIRKRKIHVSNNIESSAKGEQCLSLTSVLWWEWDPCVVAIDDGLLGLGKVDELPFIAISFSRAISSSSRSTRATALSDCCLWCLRDLKPNSEGGGEQASTRWAVPAVIPPACRRELRDSSLE